MRETKPLDGHDITGQDRRVTADGCWHRLTCACGWAPEAGPHPFAVAAEQEAFRRYAEHVSGHTPRPAGPSSEPFVASVDEDRRIWETGRRPRPVRPAEDA